MRMTFFYPPPTPMTTAVTTYPTAVRRADKLDKCTTAPAAPPAAHQGGPHRQQARARRLAPRVRGGEALLSQGRGPPRRVQGDAV